MKDNYSPVENYDFVIKRHPSLIDAIPLSSLNSFFSKVSESNLHMVKSPSLINKLRYWKFLVQAHIMMYKLAPEILKNIKVIQEAGAVALSEANKEPVSEIDKNNRNLLKRHFKNRDGFLSIKSDATPNLGVLKRIELTSDIVIFFGKYNEFLHELDFINVRNALYKTKLVSVIYEMELQEHISKYTNIFDSELCDYSIFKENNSDTSVLIIEPKKGKYSSYTLTKPVVDIIDNNRFDETEIIKEIKSNT